MVIPLGIVKRSFGNGIALLDRSAFLIPAVSTIGDPFSLFIGQGLRGKHRRRCSVLLGGIMKFRTPIVGGGLLQCGCMCEAGFSRWFALDANRLSYRSLLVVFASIFYSMCFEA